MNFKNIVKAAIASAILIAPISSAYAYSIHYKDGKYYVTCDNGDRWTRGNGTQQITHADAANICAKRGSSLIAPDLGPKPGSMKKAPADVVKLN
jgi:hypothetical protein